MRFRRPKGLRRYPDRNAGVMQCVKATLRIAGTVRMTRATKRLDGLASIRPVIETPLGARDRRRRRLAMHLRRGRLRRERRRRRMLVERLIDGLGGAAKFGRKGRFAEACRRQKG